MKRITFLLLLAAAFTACQPKKESVRSAVNPPGVGILGGTTVPACTQVQSAIGAIYDSANASAYGTFDDRVKSLLSATMLAENIGTVGTNSNEGVRFTGTMFLDSAGNVVSSKSKLTISIYDSVWAANPTVEAPIPIEFDPTKGSVLSGQFSPTTGQGYLLLKDQYGEIRFDGSYNSMTFTGQVTFKNSVNASGGAATSGTLGQFTINSCGIVQK